MLQLFYFHFNFDSWIIRWWHSYGSKNSWSTVHELAILKQRSRFQNIRKLTDSLLLLFFNKHQNHFVPMFLKQYVWLRVDEDCMIILLEKVSPPLSITINFLERNIFICFPSLLIENIIEHWGGPGWLEILT